MAMAAAGESAPPASRILLLSFTIFIILSGVRSHQCHWCGPLAEQVHRSRRAPPCEEPGGQLATCDPGYPYCAIVATSPPYVESRYCVKIYQDECYPLFCNSTKTWRMTCSCRGDLCNGANAEREIDSFAILSKLVAETHNSRIEKRSTETEGQSTVVPQSDETSTVIDNINNVHAETIKVSPIPYDEVLNNINVLVYAPDVELSKDSNNFVEELFEGNNRSTVNTSVSVEIPAENEAYPNIMQADEPMKVPLDIKSENIVTNIETLSGKQDVISSTVEIIIENQTIHKVPNSSKVDTLVLKSTTLNTSDELVHSPDVELSEDSNNFVEELIEGNNRPTVNTSVRVGIPTENEENPNIMQGDEPMKVSLVMKSENIVTNAEIRNGKQDVISSTAEIIIEKHTTHKDSMITEGDTIKFKSIKATNDGTDEKLLKTKEEMPTAEALQHNENQVGKTTTCDSQGKDVDVKTDTSAEPTVVYTTPSTLLTTLTLNINNHPTATSPKAGKNNAPMLMAHITFPIITVFILRLQL